MSPSRPESLTVTQGMDLDVKSSLDLMYIHTSFSLPLRLFSIESVLIVRAITGSHLGHKPQSINIYLLFDSTWLLRGLSGA